MQRAATFLWWLLVIAGAAGLWWAHTLSRGGGVGVGPTPMEECAGRFALGGARLVPAQSAKLVEGLGLEDLPPEQRLRMVAVVAELSGAEAAKEQLDLLRGRVPEADRAAFSQIYVDLAPPPTDPGFVHRNGWFARLALARGLPDDHPLRRTLLDEARRTFLRCAGAFFAVAVAGLLGLVLLALGLAGLGKGRLRFAYEPPPRAPLDRVWLGPLALLLAGVIGTAFLGEWSMWLLLAVPLWPLARGVGLAEWRSGLGLLRGRGIFREVGAGLLGYLAGLPVFALGAIVSLQLARALGQPIRHPAMDDTGGGGAGLLHLLLAACVWAPLVEEAVFRGAFQRYLRPRLSRLVAAAVVGLLFAFVHPQGLAAIPALMSIGGWFALLREWRGTLVPCVAAHAVHNLALVLLSVLVLS